MNRTGGKVQFAARFVFMRLFVVCKFVYSYLILLIAILPFIRFARFK